MATYKNFFETIEEALMRLKGTVVLYDKDPVHVWTITNHKSDGVFRIYVSPIEDMKNGAAPSPIHVLPQGHTSMGAAMDLCVDGPNKIPNLRILRKKMNSPLFNRYRPFPLGMINDDGHAVYVERSPNRPKTEQGLVSSQLRSTIISAASGNNNNNNNYVINMYSDEFRDCIIGDHPTPNECLVGLLSDKNVNNSVAFHRNFALVKGPIGTLFLAYKQDVVGLLPTRNFNLLVLGHEFKHLKEAVQELNLFSSIQ